MSEAHYFEFLEKAYSGKVVANVKVSELYFVTTCVYSIATA